MARKPRAPGQPAWRRWPGHQTVVRNKVGSSQESLQLVRAFKKTPLVTEYDTRFQSALQTGAGTGSDRVIVKAAVATPTWLLWHHYRC